MIINYVDHDVTLLGVREEIGLRELARDEFDGSDTLFQHCWSFYWLRMNADPTDMEDLIEGLHDIASVKVLDPTSTFFRG